MYMFQSNSIKDFFSVCNNLHTAAFASILTIQQTF